MFYATNKAASSPHFGGRRCFLQDWTRQAVNIARLPVYTHSNELPIPSAAANDTRDIELLRVWAAGGKQHVSLATGLWSDPANWGIMLVDLAKHIANAYTQADGTSPAAVLQRLERFHLGYSVKIVLALRVTLGKTAVG